MTMMYYFAIYGYLFFVVLSSVLQTPTYSVFYMQLVLPLYLFFPFMSAAFPLGRFTLHQNIWLEYLCLHPSFSMFFYNVRDVSAGSVWALSSRPPMWNRTFAFAYILYHPFYLSCLFDSGLLCFSHLEKSDRLTRCKSGGNPWSIAHNPLCHNKPEHLSSSICDTRTSCIPHSTACRTPGAASNRSIIPGTHRGVGSLQNTPVRKRRGQMECHGSLEVALSSGLHLLEHAQRKTWKRARC